MIVPFLLWSSILIIVWTFFLYPLIMLLVSRIYPTPWRQESFRGKVSMIIAAHNEEEVIREKVENCLQVNFGPADYEIIIVSDGSTDATNDILAEFLNTSDRLKIITYQPRAGKANALNVAFQASSGDILLFSDANVLLNQDAPAKLLRSFADQQVGAICGKVLVRGQGESEIAGESLYMKLEGAIQRAEAKFGNMVGIDGALFALRRELFRPLSTNLILDDFALAMEAVLTGKRIVYADDAKAVEEVEASTANEFRRKSRIIAGGYQYLSWLIRMKKTMAPAPLFSFISRKVLRWLAPLFMITAFIANFLLISLFPYYILFCGQIIFYLLALCGLFFPTLRNTYLFYLPYYFCSINAASLVGLGRFLSRRQDILWEKVSR